MMQANEYNEDVYNIPRLCSDRSVGYEERNEPDISRVLKRDEVQ